MMDLSFLVECATPVAVKESPLAGLVEDVKFEFKPQSLGKIKLAALKREDYAKRPEILEKYFKNGNCPLDRFHVPELTAQQYAAIVGKVNNPKNAELETASDYYIRKARLTQVAKDLGVSYKQLDLTDYIWDERYYIVYDFIDNIRLVDDWYRDHSVDERYESTAYDAYIRKDPRTAVLDTDLYNELYTFCISAIRQRKAMLLGKVDKCLGMLRNIIEYTQGFVENPTSQMMASLRGYKKYFETLLQDEAMVEWLKTNNDITVYAEDERTHSDYIDTYRALIKGLVSGSDEDIKTFADILTCIEDPYYEELIEIRNVDYAKTWELDIAH